ncbi:MAG TPA: hypothetical protein VMU80_08690 [Bryobacteraceae bacterium]|nr:hypothetical protein [Bryobacteraceae bacterium]
MERRSFISSMATLGLLAQTEAPAGAQSSAARTHLYRVDYFYNRQGEQVDRLMRFFSSQTPLFV